MAGAGPARGRTLQEIGTKTRRTGLGHGQPPLVPANARLKSMAIDGNRWQSMAIDGNRWQLVNARTVTKILCFCYSVFCAETYLT